MTLAPLSPTPSAPPEPDRIRSGRRRLWVHILLLGATLVALLPVAGTDAVWTADEGALLYQADAVADGRGWELPHPFPEIDPEGIWYPIHLAGFAPPTDADTDAGASSGASADPVEPTYIVLGKHALLVRAVGTLHTLGGYRLVLLISVLGGLVAAMAAAALAGRIEDRAAVPALWLTGLASPLFLSSYVVWGHTVAAALVGWAAVGLTRPVERTGSRIAWPWPVLGAVALAAACLIRTEATLAGIALTLALAGEAAIGRWVTRPRPALGPAPERLPLLSQAGPAVLAGLATVGGFTLDRITSVSRAGPVRDPGDRWGGLAGRFEGFYHTWLKPDFSDRPEHVLLLVAAAAVVAAGVLARTRGPNQAPVLAALAAAAACLTLRLVISPTALIPGLVVAFPVLFAGLALLGRADLARRPTRILLGFTGLFWLAVLATQYQTGGGGEWGGRYFALALPAAVAVVTPALLRTADRVRAERRRLVFGLAAFVILVPVAMGLLGLRQARDTTRSLTDLVEERLADAGDGSDRPVVVTTLPPLGRWAWQDVDRSRWLLVLPEQLPDLAGRLDQQGVERFLFVSESPRTELAGLSPRFEPVDPYHVDTRSGLDQVVIPMTSNR